VDKLSVDEISAALDKIYQDISILKDKEKLVESIGEEAARLINSKLTEYMNVLKSPAARMNIDEKDLKYISSQFINYLRNQHLSTGKDTEKFVKQIEKELRDALRAGSDVSQSSANLHFIQGLLQATAQSQQNVFKGKGPVPINLESEKEGAKVLYSANEEYLTPEDLEGSMDSFTKKLFEFLTNQSIEDTKQDKKNTINLARMLIDGLWQSKFVGGVIRDGARLLGLTMASKLSHLGGIGKLLGTIAYATSSFLPQILAALLSAGVGSFAGSFLGNLGPKKALNFVKTAGIKAAPYLAGFGAISNAGGIVEGVKTGDKKQVTGESISLAGNLITAFAPFFGPGAPIAMIIGQGINLIGMFWKDISEWLSKIFHKDDDKDSGDPNAVYELAKTKVGASTLLPLPARGPSFGQPAKTYADVPGIPLRAPSNTVGAPTDTGTSPSPTPSSSAVSPKSESSLSFEKVEGLYRLSPHVMTTSKGVLAGTHFDPYAPKIDITAAKGLTEEKIEQIARGIGINVKATYEKEGQGRSTGSHFDLRVLDGKGRSYNKVRGGEGYTSLKDLKKAYSNEPIFSKDGYLMNAYQLESRSGAEAIWKAMQKNPKIRENYEFVKDPKLIQADSFETDIYSEKYGALVFKGGKRLVQALQQQGYNTQITSGMGSAGRIYNREKFGRVIMGFKSNIAPKPKVDEKPKQEEKPKKENKLSQEGSSKVIENLNSKETMKAPQIAQEPQTTPSSSKNMANVPGNKTYSNLCFMANIGVDAIRET